MAISILILILQHLLILLANDRSLQTFIITMQLLLIFLIEFDLECYWPIKINILVEMAYIHRTVDFWVVLFP